MKRYLSLILLILVLSCSSSEQSDTLRILFIGNSYTYYNSTPELVKALFQEKFPDQHIETQLISQGGMTLQRHWEDEHALEAIRSGQWDYVVLQEQSKLGMGVIIDDNIYFGQTDLFFEYARKFDAEIKNSGAETAFFMTWSVRDQPEEQEILTYAYSEIADELDATLIPIGLVWKDVRTNENIDLYVADGSHPSPLGSYLAATAIFATLTGESPIGLSGNISGKNLSSSGVPSSESQVLIDISQEDALEIQKASWAVLESMQDGYAELAQPQPSYDVPLMPQGENMKYVDIKGRWFGTSTYGSDYLGLILDITHTEVELNVDIFFYSPDRQDQLTVVNETIEDNLLVLTVFDSLRMMPATVRFALTSDQTMTGLLESSGNLTLYKHLNLSRRAVQNNLDLAAFDELWQSFQSNIEQEGYVKAAIDHYILYSLLIGQNYMPEEAYLNAQGYNFLRDERITDALNQFELALYLYPESVNTYDSYGEALVIAGQKEKALAIYTEGYELAKKTDDENLSYIEANLNKLKEGVPVNQEIQAPPPPPPPSTK